MKYFQSSGHRFGMACRSIACLIVAVCCVLASFAVDAQRDAGGKYLALWSQGDYQEALEEIQRRMALYEDNRIPTQMRFLHGQLLFATGQIDHAIDAFKAASNRHPEPEYFMALVDAYDYRGQPTYRDNTLRRVSTLIRGNRWQFSVRPGNLVAVARVHEMNGESPKTLLNTFYKQVFDRFPSATEAYVGAGELALRYAGYSVASQHFERALELDAEDQDALAGLCETYWRSGDRRLEATIARLAELNPNHPRLLALQTQLVLDAGLVDEAMELIERGLSINPKNLDLLAYKAAAHFLNYEDEAHRAALDEIIEFNPLRSQAYRLVGQVAARHYRFKKALAFQERALEINPQDHEARAEYTLNLMRLGEEQEGREELEKAFDANQYSVTLYNLLSLMDTLQEFETIETDDFILKLPKREAPVLAEAALELLDDALTQFEAEYDITVERPVLIELFDQHDDFMVRSMGLPGNVGHLGICFGKVVTMDTPSVRPPGSSNWHSVLWHEFVHVITLQKTKNRMPRWLSEGISVFEEERRRNAWHNRMEPGYAAIIQNEDWPGLRDIQSLFIKPRSSNHLMFGYFISAEFVKFYVGEFGFDALVRALQRIADKQTTEDALAAAAGASEEALDAAFHEYLDEQLAVYDNIPAPPEEGHAAVGPPDSPFTDALNAAREAIEKQDFEEAKDKLREAQSLFPDYNAPDAPLRQLAALYKEQGKEADRIAVLEELLRSAPAELDAAKELSEYHASEGAWKPAIEATEWLIEIDPYDVAARRRLVDAYRAVGDYDKALQHLKVAGHLDASRGPEHRLLRSELLSEANRDDEARHEVVRLLEDLPHYWDAQELLLELVEDNAEPAGEPSS